MTDTLKSDAEVRAWLDKVRDCFRSRRDGSRRQSLEGQR